MGSWYVGQEVACVRKKVPGRKRVESGRLAIGQVYKILYIEPDPGDLESVGFEFGEYLGRCFSEHLFEPAVKPSATMDELRNILRDVAREKEAV